MAKFRRYFYLSSVVLSGVCLCLMFLLIIAQTFARSVSEIIPSSEDFAAWLLSATFFFGLAYTFYHNSHIRMTILLDKLSNKNRFRQEIINHTIGLAITSYLSFYVSYTVYESYYFNDVTDTYLPMPLYLVQLPMAIGSLFLLLAMLDRLYLLIAKKESTTKQNKQ